MAPRQMLDEFARTAQAVIVANRTAPAGDARSDAAIRQADAHRCRAVRIQVLTQRGRCRHQLERGSWRIQAVARPVQQRIRRVFRRRDRPGRERPGIARARQQVAGIRIDHHGRGPTRGLAGVRRRQSWRPGAAGSHRSSVARRAAGFANGRARRCSDRSDAAAPARARGSHAGASASAGRPRRSCARSSRDRRSRAADLRRRARHTRCWVRSS